MYKVYFDGKLLAETDDWDVACDCAIENDGIVVDAETEVLLFDSIEDEEEDYDFDEEEDYDFDEEEDWDFDEEEDWDFDEADLEMDFNPYMGCYDFDC